MEQRRWVNPSQPQTLYTATFLLYLNAAFGLLFGAFVSAIGILIVIGEVAAAYGIANERRWGYLLGVAMAGLALLPFVLLAVDDGLTELLQPVVLLNMIFPVALFALLVHPMSRDYQKVWFS
jgi:hypothetical protein